MTTPLRKSLRLWPGIIIVILQWLIRFGLPAIAPEAIVYGVLGELAGWLGIVIWWVLLSRAPWSERLGAIFLMIVGFFATSRILDKSIATGGQGMLFLLLLIPVLSLAFVSWAVVTRHLSDRLRRATMAAAILIACGAWALVRTGGLTADLNSDLHWRWSKTPEQRLLADRTSALPLPSKAAPESPTPAETPSGADKQGPSESSADRSVLAPAPAKVEAGDNWPGFRGPHRDDVVPGVRINTDWAASPPALLWRRTVGPGWSSFAAGGELIYTQEQRGPDEVVTCYRLTTGQPVWAHRDNVRFWESNGGPGPRATPAIRNGRVYTLGSTGILNALDARNGAVAWSRNVSSDSNIEVPMWGFAGSPLVLREDVIIAAAGRLISYEIATGRPRWFGPPDRTGYSSPHLMTINGIQQVLLLSGSGAISVAPADGALLWRHSWEGTPIVQPARTADGDVLVSTSSAAGGIGIRRLAIALGPRGWNVEECWSSNGLKPYFNDFVVHKGYAFGFDGSILACIDLQGGTRKWKGGRYGNGQLLMLPDQDIMIVISEEGELVLVGANPDKFAELARFPAIDGKTWNHPVLVGDILLVRNGQEMAAFRLPIARHGT